MKGSFKKFLTAALTAAVLCLPLSAFAAENEVASVEGTSYTSVQAAVDNANGKTVKLLSDVTESITIAKDSAVTLDLGSFALTNTAGKHTITNLGTLIIEGDGTGRQCLARGWGSCQ